ncbi:UNVERIFIED_CONTAM: hypothetical protein NCL1_49736 [Trichonephila clavipes]
MFWRTRYLNISTQLSDFKLYLNFTSRTTSTCLMSVLNSREHGLRNTIFMMLYNFAILDQYTVTQKSIGTHYQFIDFYRNILLKHTNKTKKKVNVILVNTNNNLNKTHTLIQLWLKLTVKEIELKNVLKKVLEHFSIN